MQNDPLQTYQETAREVLAKSERVVWAGDDGYSITPGELDLDQATEALTTAAQLYANQRVVEELEMVKLSLAHSATGMITYGLLINAIDTRIASYKKEK